MSGLRMTLRSFLQHAKSALLKAGEQDPSGSRSFTFVIGNESADLDSLTSSLLYAYVRSCKPPPEAFTSLYIPLLNIPARDIGLRPEFLALLPHGDFESGNLITLDDFHAVEARLSPEDTRWILVDHNALQGGLGTKYATYVTGVIDHHDDEGKVPKDTGCEPRIITPSGSCTSLVTNYCRQTWDSLSDRAVQSKEHSHECDAQTAKLALASILIDTTNLTAKGKTTEHDINAVLYLESKIRDVSSMTVGFDRTSFYHEIDAAKKDIGSLHLVDILRKDYKEWTEQGDQKLGISSVVKPLSFLQAKAQNEADYVQSEDEESPFLAAIRDFAKDRSLDLYTIMTTYTSADDEFQRELFVWALTSKAVSAAKRFVNAASGELGLEDWCEARSVEKLSSSEGDKEFRKVWRQGNVEHSRKQVAPLLRHALR
ncbi:hypothetical protein BJ546DRAFT_40283 [Cryomyces antarcticus]|nr:Exopolyphosphatase [Cryomyces antarcticus]